MPINQESLNAALFKLLKSNGYEPDTRSSSGELSGIPDEAEVFQFKFRKDGEDYGTVTASIDGLTKLVLYYGKSVADSPKSGAGGDMSWPELRSLINKWRFSKGIRTFELKDESDLKYDMAKREHTRKLDEGYYPINKHSSYNDSVPNVKIKIMHTEALGENDQRFRKVARIYLENVDGERFLLDTKRPGIARVYARHLAEGGKVNDDRWGHIHSLVEDYTKMAGFVRATRNNQFNESTQQLVNEGINHYTSLRETLHKLTGKKGYNAYFESYTPTLTEDHMDATELTERFMSSSLDPRIESAMPILAKISKKISEMAEVTQLEEWTNTVDESIYTNNAPQVKKLTQLLSKELIVGVDAINAKEALSSLGLHDDDLDFALDSLAEENPDADVSDDVLDWMAQSKNHKFHEIVSRVNKLKQPPPQQQAQPAPQPAPAPAPQQAAPQPQPVAEAKGLTGVYADVIELKDMGMSIMEIAKLTGISPQEVEMIIDDVEGSSNDEVYEDLPPPENARKTQIASTLGTYKKAGAMFDKEGVKGSALDFGAGLGKGTAELGKDAESYEPYPREGFKPHYIDATKIPSNKYHKIVNLNVLNVVPNVEGNRIRDEIVRQIGRVLAPGGVALITTRGRDVLTIKGTPGEEPMSMISSIGTYQKGFSGRELRDYVQGVLGDNFAVSIIKLGPAGVMIKKHAESEDVAESLRQGEHHTWTVHFDDGTSGQINVQSDETTTDDIKSHYAKKGKNVVKVDKSYGVHGYQTSSPKRDSSGDAGERADRERQAHIKHDRSLTETDVEESLDKDQKQAGQLGPTDKVSTGKVLGRKLQSQKGLRGKLVGASESVDPLIRLRNLSGLNKE